MFVKVSKFVYIHQLFVYFFDVDFRGGLFGGYCGPPSFKGVCCVFSTTDCNRRITEKISYFSNKSFPKQDLEPFQCLLSIKPLKDTCWVRFDLETFELAGSTSCGFDSMTILNSPLGRSGGMCGHKSGFATLTKPPTNKDLNLAIRVQGPSYR